MAYKSKAVMPDNIDIELMEYVNRGTCYATAECYRECDAVRKILEELFDSSLNISVHMSGPKSVEEDGFPHLCFERLGRSGCVWIRVRTDKVHYTDEEIRKADDIDRKFKEAGQRVNVVPDVRTFVRVMEREGMWS